MTRRATDGGRHRLVREHVDEGELAAVRAPASPRPSASGERRPPGRVLAWSLVVGIATGWAGAAASGPFEEVLRARFPDLDVPGLGFALVSDGAVTEAGGLGVADASSGARVDAATPFRVASLTKPLAAALLLNAARAGAVDLDAPLRAVSSRFRHACAPMKAHFAIEGLPYLDGIACGDDGVTVRRVLTHTARRPAGDAFSYNGFLFGLLDEPVGDAVAGGGEDGFRRAVRERVVEALGLERSAAGIGDPEGRDVMAELAPPHRRDGERWVVRARLRAPPNAGAGFVASATDMARIDLAYRDRLLDDPAIWGRMTTPVELSHGTLSPYGAGWFVQEIDGRRIVWHRGHQPGAYSALWIEDVELGRALVLLANGDGLVAGDGLHLGDLTRSSVASAFLEWSAARAKR